MKTAITRHRRVSHPVQRLRRLTYPGGLTVDSKTRYERVLGAVRHNTGGSQPPLASERAIRTVCCSTGSLSVDGYERSLRAAVENDDLLEWNGHLAIAESDALRAVIEAEVSCETPNRDLVARCNRLLDSNG